MSNEILDIAARMKELREICEFSPEEMARELNIKPDSLRMSLTRARKTAYQLLQEK